MVRLCAWDVLPYLVYSQLGDAIEAAFIRWSRRGRLRFEAPPALDGQCWNDPVMHTGSPAQRQKKSTLCSISRKVLVLLLYDEI